MPWLPPRIDGGFRRLYPEPQSEAPASPEQEAAEAVSADSETLERAGDGRAANLLEAGDPRQGPDIVVGHLSPGEIVVPPSAQTPEVVAALRAALGDELPAYTVGSGQERRNPVSGLVAFADTWSVPGHPVPSHGPNRGGQMGRRRSRRGGGITPTDAARWIDRQIQSGREWVRERGLGGVAEAHIQSKVKGPIARGSRKTFNPHETSPADEMAKDGLAFELFKQERNVDRNILIPPHRDRFGRPTWKKNPWD
jgi:hypothetical protein